MSTDKMLRSCGIYIPDKGEKVPLKKALDIMTDDWILGGNDSPETTCDLVRALRVALRPDKDDIKSLLPSWAIAILIVAAFILGTACPARPAEVVATVVRVIDGDTIKADMLGSIRTNVRLAEIDAPETRTKQPGGLEAKAALAALVAVGAPVVIDVQTTDRYGRVVGRVYCNRRRDVSAEMVASGHAWVYRQYSHDRRLVMLEDAARAGRVGLWADKNPIPPWIWRRQAR